MTAGVLNQISFKKETTWGTPVVPDKSLPVHLTGGIVTNNNQQIVTALKAQLAKAVTTFIGARAHEGEYEMDLFPDYVANLVASAMGGVNTALHAGESIVYDHTLTEAETKVPLTIEQVIGDDVRRFAGAIATGFKVSVKTGEPVVINFPFKAKSQATATKITPAYTTVEPLNFSQVAFKIGGVTIGEVTSAEIEYKNNIEFLHALNSSNDAAYNFVKGSEITGKIEMYLDNTTLASLTDYLAGTTRSFQLLVTGPSIGVGANYVFNLTIPKGVYKTAETKLGEDYNMLSVEFEGIYDTSTSKLFNVVMTNLLTTL